MERETSFGYITVKTFEELTEEGISAYERKRAVDSF